MIEEWRIIKRAEDVTKGPKYTYEISNYGRIKRNGLLYDGVLLNSGYKTVCHKLLHRLIIEHFIGAIPDGYVVDHIDGNKLNNRLDNLKICTQKDNIHNILSYNKILTVRNTDEYKKHQSDIHKGKLKGKIHINNGEIEKFIFPEELKEYEKQGFKKGCLYDKYIKIKNTWTKKNGNNNPES